MIKRQFRDYKPTSVNDQPWVQARIEESPTRMGPWTVIDTITLDPVDIDPANPMYRDLETLNGTLEYGWYRIVFVDADGNTDQPTTPVTAIPLQGFDGAMMRALLPSVAFADLGYPATTPDPLDGLILEAVPYLEDLTGQVPLYEPTPITLLPVAQRAVALRVAQIVYGLGGDNLSADASGVQSFSVPGYSETRASSSAQAKSAPPANTWGALWEAIWTLMTPNKREEWLAQQRGEDVPYFDIIDLDVPGAGLSDPYFGAW